MCSTYYKLIIHTFPYLAFVCIGLLSRVRATRDHRGKDCRFLNFKKGDVIFVYHKLSGKRDDLWAGSVSVFFVTEITLNNIYFVVCLFCNNVLCPMLDFRLTDDLVISQNTL